MPSSTVLYTLSLHDALPILMSWDVDGCAVRDQDRLRAVPPRGARAQQERGRTVRGRGARNPRAHAALLGVELDAVRSEVSGPPRSEEHTSELQSLTNLVCRLRPCSTLFPYTTLFRS